MTHRAMVVALVLAACEAQPHVNVTVRPALDPAKLHVEVHEGALDWFEADVIAKHIAPTGIDCETQLSIGPRHVVRLRAWYDANGNGRRDPGELFGELGSDFEAVDHGGCSEREPNRAPDIVLASVRE